MMMMMRSILKNDLPLPKNFNKRIETSMFRIFTSNILRSRHLAKMFLNLYNLMQSKCFKHHNTSCQEQEKIDNSCSIF